MVWWHDQHGGIKKNTHLDPQHHLQTASRVFHCKKKLCVIRACPFYIGSDVSKRLYPQLLVLMPIHRGDLAKLDVDYRELMRMVVGPPADTNLGITMARYVAWMEQESRDAIGVRWPDTFVFTCILCSNFPPEERSIRRIPEWNLRRLRKRRRLAYTWETALPKYSICKSFDNWIVEAATYADPMSGKFNYLFLPP